MPLSPPLPFPPPPPSPPPLFPSIQKRNAPARGWQVLNVRYCPPHAVADAAAPASVDHYATRAASDRPHITVKTVGVLSRVQTNIFVVPVTITSSAISFKRMPIDIEARKTGGRGWVTGGMSPLRYCTKNRFFFLNKSWVTSRRCISFVLVLILSVSLPPSPPPLYSCHTL